MDGRRYRPLSWHNPAAADFAVSRGDEFAIRPNEDGDGLEYSYDTSAWAPLAGAGSGPAGSGSEIQCRVDATTFGAVTGSSVSGADILIAGNVKGQFTTAINKQAISGIVTYNNSSSLSGSYANIFSTVDNNTASGDTLKWGVYHLYTWGGSGTYSDHIAQARFNATASQDLAATLRTIYISAPSIASGKTLTTWEGIRIGPQSGSGTITNKRAIVVETGCGDVVLNVGSNLATSATSGFTFLPVTTDLPTGTPASYTGARAVVIEEDTSNSQYNLYGYLNGAWRNLSNGTSGYATAQDEGTPVTQRSALNFIGGAVSVSDDAGNSRTNVTIGAAVNSGSTGQVSYVTGSQTLGGVSGSTVSGADVTWAGYQVQTFNNANTSGTYSYYDQNITITAASNSTASHYLRDVGITFSTAVNTASVRLTYASIDHNQTGTVSSFYGSHITYSNTAGTTTTVGGHNFTYSSSAGTTSQAIGYTSGLNVTTGTLSAATGFYALFDQSGGTFTTATGFKVFTSGTIGTLYAFYASASSATTKYAFYSEAGAGDILHRGGDLTMAQDGALTLIVKAYHSSSVAQWYLHRGRGTEASPTAIQSGDTLGVVNFTGQYDTSTTLTAANIGAAIQALAAADWNGSDTPTDVVIKTKSALGLSSRVALRATSDRYVGIGDNIAHSDIGAQLHVISSGASVVGAIITTAASGTADALRIQHNGTTRVKFAAVSGGAINSVFSDGALSTSATDGFLYAPSCAGAPSGSPTSYTGTVPMVFDTTNSRLYARMGGSWVNITGSGGYATVQDEGTPVTQRATINFIGGAVSVADDSGNSRTNVTIAAAVNSGSTGQISYVTGTQTIGGISGTSVSGADVTWAGYQTQTFTNTNTSGTYSYYDQNITISPASNSTATHRLFDLGVTFGTAVNTASLQLAYADITHGQSGTVSSFYGSNLTYHNTAGTTSTVTGHTFTYNDQAGTTSQAIAYQANLNANGGTLSSAIGYYVTADRSSGTYTAVTGFRMFTSGTIGTVYGIVLPTSYNGIGVSSPTAALDMLDTSGGTLLRAESANHRLTLGASFLEYFAGGDSAYPGITFRRQRTALTGTAAVTSGDSLGLFNWQGRSSAGTVTAATMEAFVEGTVGAGIVPARLEFYTVDAAGSSHSPLIMDSNGDTHLPYRTSSFSDTPKDHTGSLVAPIRVSNISSVYKIHVYLGGAWRSVTLT